MPKLNEYVEGDTLVFRASATNTGPSTINDGHGAMTIKRPDGHPLQAGDICTGQAVYVDWATGMARTSQRDRCEYCPGAVVLTEIVPFEKAVCPKCGAAHGWGDEDANWFGM